MAAPGANGASVTRPVRHRARGRRTRSGCSCHGSNHRLPAAPGAASTAAPGQGGPAGRRKSPGLRPDPAPHPLESTTYSPRLFHILTAFSPLQVLLTTLYFPLCLLFLHIHGFEGKS